MLISMISMSAVGQFNLTGRILDAADEEPIQDAEVILSGDSYYTDRSGNFSISVAVEKNYTVGCLKQGEYAGAQFQLRPDTIYTLYLDALGATLDEVVILDTVDRMSSYRPLRAVEGTAIYAAKKSSVIRLDPLVVNRAASLSRQMYAELPGITIYEADDAGIQLNLGGRGLEANRSAHFNIRQNGYDISADPLGYPESYYSPPAEAIDELRVVRGAASLQYGTQFGGLLDFRLRRPSSEPGVAGRLRQTIGSYGFTSSFADLDYSKGSWGIYGYYNYKGGSGFRPHSNYSAHTAHLHVQHRLSDQTKIWAELSYMHYLSRQPGGLTDAQFYRDPVFSNRSRNWFRVDWRMIGLGIEHRWSSRLQTSLLLNGLDARRDALGFRPFRVSQPDDLSSPRDLISDNFLHGAAELRTLYHYTLGSRPVVLLAGLKYYRSDNHSVQDAGSVSEEANFEPSSDFPFYPRQSRFDLPNYNVAAFIEKIIYLSDKFSITPGLRLEYIRTEADGFYRRVDVDLLGDPIRDSIFTDMRSYSRNILLGGLGLSYRPTEQTELLLNISQNYRSVTFNDIRIQRPGFQLDPDIEDERGWSVDLAYRGTQSGGWQWDVGAFLLYYDGRIGELLTAEERVQASGEIRPTGRIVRYRSNLGTALSYGLESTISYVLDIGSEGSVQLFSNLAVTGSEYIRSSLPGVEGNEIEGVPRWNLRTGARLRYGALGLSVQYSTVSAQFTDATNAVQDRQDDLRGIQGAIPSYAVADFSAQYDWRAFRLEAGINNVMNAYYFTRRASGYPGPGIIPSIPRNYYLGIQYRW